MKIYTVNCELFGTLDQLTLPGSLTVRPWKYTGTQKGKDRLPSNHPFFRGFHSLLNLGRVYHIWISPINHGHYPPVNKHSNGKSPSWIGNTSSNGGFSMAMLDYRSVKKKLLNCRSAAPELVDQETSPWSKKGHFLFHPNVGFRNTVSWELEHVSGWKYHIYLKCTGCDSWSVGL